MKGKAFASSAAVWTAGRKGGRVTVSLCTVKRKTKGASFCLSNTTYLEYKVSAILDWKQHVSI